MDVMILFFNKLQRDTRYSATVKKFFYFFNLRDLSKICEGVMMSTQAAYKGKPEILIKLFVHEC